MAKRTVALTTGQAARYCLVSPDTIVNWIKAKCLPAQRTMGGQYRIFVDDLRQFMVRNGMSTELLDAELECRPYCWEFHQGIRHGQFVPDFPCVACPVYRVMALNCFDLRTWASDRGSWSDRQCSECTYFRKWAEPSANKSAPNQTQTERRTTGPGSGPSGDKSARQNR